MPARQSDNNEVSILSRIPRPEMPTFSREAAHDILALDFDQADKDRMRRLSDRSREGTLTPEEDAEAGRYERVGHLRNILQSKARRSLQVRPDPGGKRQPGMN